MSFAKDDASCFPTNLPRVGANIVINSFLSNPYSIAKFDIIFACITDMIGAFVFGNGTHPDVNAKVDAESIIVLANSFFSTMDSI